MTLAEIQAEVALLTNRPDLLTTGEIGSAIRKATLKMHSTDFYPQDLIEQQVTFADGTLFNQTLPVANLTRFRAVRYIREAALTGHTGLEQYFEKNDPDAVLDEYYQEKQLTWYLGGSNINMKGRMAMPAVLIGYYAYPLVSPDLSYSSWIAGAMPYAIIEEACANIFSVTGYAEMAAKYAAMSNENIALLKMNYLDGVAR